MGCKCEDAIRSFLLLNRIAADNDIRMDKIGIVCLDCMICHKITMSKNTMVDWLEGDNDEPGRSYDVDGEVS